MCVCVRGGANNIEFLYDPIPKPEFPTGLHADTWHGRVLLYLLNIMFHSEWRNKSKSGLRLWYKQCSVLSSADDETSQNRRPFTYMV